MRRNLFVFASLVTSGLFIGCGDDAAEPANQPEILGSMARAQCRVIDDGLALDVVEFVAEDLDGASDLVGAWSQVLATRLPMTATAIPWDDADGDCGGVDAEGVVSCRVKYRWEYARGEALIRCGEDLNLGLEVYVEAEDQGGLTHGAIILPTEL